MIELTIKIMKLLNLMCKKTYDDTNKYTTMKLSALLANELDAAIYPVIYVLTALLTFCVCSIYLTTPHHQATVPLSNNNLTC